MYLILCDLQTSKMRLARLFSCVGTGLISGTSRTQNWTHWAAFTYSKKVWIDKVMMAENGNFYSSSSSSMPNSFLLLPLSSSPYVQTFSSALRSKTHEKYKNQLFIDVCNSQHASYFGSAVFDSQNGKPTKLIIHLQQYKKRKRCFSDKQNDSKHGTSLTKDKLCQSINGHKRIDWSAAVQYIPDCSSRTLNSSTLS